MTSEKKQLLLKDLCARLPYQPLCKKVDTEDDFCECDAPLGYSLRDLVDNKIIIKPYLRPMSSITEEEENEWHGLNIDPLFEAVGEQHTRIEDLMLRVKSQYRPLDWLNAHHFDYRGLIDRGLALEAPEGMYK